MRARRERRPPGRVAVAVLRVGDADLELAAGGHGLDGVADEVGEHPAHLHRVGAHAELAGRAGERERAAGAGERAERAPLAADEGREVQHPGADRLAGREPEQAGRELAAAARGLLDVGDVRRRVVRRLAGEPGVAEQDRQQVVDLVGDAAREPAEALHLLRVPQLLLEPAHVGDVGREAGEAHDLPRLVADGLAAVVHVDDRAVRAHHAVLGLVAVEPAGPGRVDARAVAGMHALQPARRVGEQRVDRPAPQPLVRRAAIEHPVAVRADDPEHRAHVVREVADGIVQALP